MNMLLGKLKEKISDKYLQKIVRMKKNESLKNGHVYKDHPKVTFIAHFFNNRDNIKSVIESLRLFPEGEIIVIDDGSVDGSYKELLKQLNRPNDFFLRCNDIHEVRAYDRALGMAKGDIVCLLQDDDKLPLTKSWVENALVLFSKFPEFIILGGRNGLDIMLPDQVKPGMIYKYQRIGNICGCPGVNKYRIFDRPAFKERDLNIPFMFVSFINRAPMFLRKKEFLDLGGINQEFAPFQCDDVDACIRAWLAGYKVGFYQSSFHIGAYTGGMRKFRSREEFVLQADANWKKIYDKYALQISSGYLQKLIDEANILNKPI